VPPPQQEFYEVQAKEAARSIAALRAKLLDLSNRNQLLNFKHSLRSKGHLRIIDEIPKLVFDDLVAGKHFDFKPLPEPNEEELIPEDERTDEFEMQLENARNDDDEYKNAADKLEDRFGEDPDDSAYQEALARLDRSLRDRLRKKLGMNPWKPGAIESILAWARENDINPSFDLTADFNSHPKPSYFDRYLQTLFLNEDLGRKLGGIFEIATLALNEKGVNTLYVAFGFLEWFESDDSDKSMLAPLILLPVEIEKSVTDGEINYRIKPTGEDPECNITLIARLKQDFRVELPEIEDEEGIEPYLARIYRLLGKQQKWRIRRYVTVGHFAFSRLVMYNDLNEAKWPTDKKPRYHNLVRGMFGGTGGRSEISFAEVYNPDDKQYELSSPELIVDADSSQFSAVVDVLSGKNLVLQGPPGTGKSQTISNIIGAALEKNKKVLFVAEKMAALEVVMSRLKASGLGDLCLELHSTKAKKTHVIEALRRRMTLYPRYHSQREIDSAKGEILQAKEKIKTYLDLLDARFGFSERKLSQILWRAHLKPTESLPEHLQRLLVMDAETWTPLKEARVSRLIAELATVEATLSTRPAENPWKWIRATQLTPIDFTSIFGHCRSMLEAIERLETLSLGLSEKFAVAVPNTHEGLVRFLAGIRVVSIPTEDAEFCAAFELLSAKQQGAIVMSYVRTQSALADVTRAINAKLDLRAKPVQSVVPSLVTIRDSLPKFRSVNCCTPDDIPTLVDQWNQQANEFDRLSAWLDRVFRAIRVKPTRKEAATIEPLFALLDVLSAATTEILSDRTPQRADVDAGDSLDSIKTSWHRIKVQANVLQASLKFDQTEVDLNVVVAHRRILAEAGFFGFFRADVRAAKRYVNALFAGKPSPAKSESLVALDSLAEYCKARDGLLHDPRTEALLGNLFEGWASDIERLSRVVSWAQGVHRNFTGDGEVSTAIRKFLFSSSPADISTLKSLFSDPVGVKLGSLLSEHREMLDDLEASSNTLRKSALEFGSLSAAADKAGLRPKQDFEEVNQILSVLADHAKFSREFELISDSIKPLTPDGNIGRFVVVASHADQVRKEVEKSKLPVEIKRILLGPGGIVFWNVIQQFDRNAANPIKSVETDLLALEKFAGRPIGWAVQPYDLTWQIITKSLGAESDLYHWSTWLRTVDEIERNGATCFHSEILSGTPADSLRIHFEHIFYRSLAHRAHEKHPELRRFNGVALSEAQTRFRKLDNKLKEFSQQKVLATVCAQTVPAGNGYGSVKTYTEMALVQNEVGKSRRHIPLRDLMTRAGVAIQTLMPCFMMSPMSVAQFLRTDGITFNLIIFDEASQVLPEEALGALLRANQAVIVGDQMQLPPTDFFQRAMSGATEDMDEEEAAAIEGMESILDKGLAVFQPARRLLWHYRSRDPRLIAYSNREFYNRELQIFPAPHEKHPLLGIQLVEVNGTYSGRANVKEARAIAEAAISYMKQYPDHSLGLVSLNSTQRDIILNEVNRLLAREPKAAEYCARWQSTLEPFFVKNLENVQGDERDCVFISTVFGKNAEGNFHQRFGPINSAVGHRRLNVLFTRAKETVVLFTSIGSEDILLEETSSWGRRVLKTYLDYARTGLLDAGERTNREPDSDFEIMVQERLKIAGFQTECQVGVAGYFVDLAVRHPSHPSHFILGVECDGATYHSFKSARDRDRLRQEILERLGWKIHRIWSTDWFQNPEREIAKLVRKIQDLAQTPPVNGSDGHLNFATFSNLPATQESDLRAARSRQSQASQKQSLLTLAEDDSRGNVPHVSDELMREFNQRIMSLPDELRSKLIESVTFDDAVPTLVDIESAKTGKARVLELEEQFTRMAFDWRSRNRSKTVSALPWASNLSADVNLQLREVAVTALVKSGRA